MERVVAGRMDGGEKKASDDRGCGGVDAMVRAKR